MAHRTQPFQMSRLAQIFVTAFALWGTSAGHAAPPAQPPQEEIARGRVLLAPRAGLPAKALERILQAHQGKAQRIGQSDLYVVQVPRFTEEAVVAKLKGNPHLKYVELDRKVSSAFVPNDPMYGSEWHLPKINAPAAWDTAQGSGAVIAVLDSGVNSLHEDLQGQLVPGWNVYDNSSDTTDLTGHGTNVTGTAVAAGNNGIGVVGVASAAKVMPIGVTPPTSGGTLYSVLATGIVYAADHGVRIANASFQNVMGSSITLDAAQYLRNKNGLLVVSAGNTGSQQDWLDTPLMIQVSATDETDQLAGFSSYGNFIDVAAPGVSMWVTDMNGSYVSVRGTSFASPVTAAVLGLMMSANPALSNVDLEKLLFSTATDLGDPGKDIYFGWGRVDAAKAVQAARVATPTVDTTPPAVSVTNPTGGATVSGIVPIDVTATDNVGVARVELRANGTTVATDTSLPYAFSWDSKGVANGMANLVAVAFDAAGNSTASSAVTVNVANATPTPTTDTTPPAVALVSPVSGSVSGSVSITVNASDNSAASGIALTIYVDGVLKASGTGSTLSTTWNTKAKGTKPGSHTIQAVAKDAAGNTSTTSVSVNVTR